MRTRTTLAAITALLTLAAPAIGQASSRLLVSGKLDAAQSYDFSCSVVNKNPADDMRFEIELKDEDGNVYVNPSTFQLARLQGVLQAGESAMLVAPAGFVGVTSLYCWALVTETASAYGTFLVRDAQDRATAATPLGDDVRALLDEALGHLDPLAILAESRILASAKLDASQSYDFSCSVVNKNEENWLTQDHLDVEIRLKNADGSTYVNPSTFQPAVLEASLEPGEAAMLVAPAAFVGVTSLYCWVRLMPGDARGFGTFLVRDAQDRSTAATPLLEDANGQARDIVDAIPDALQGPGDGQSVAQFPLPAPNNHGLGFFYELCGDGTLVDRRTKLMWELKLEAEDVRCTDPNQGNRDLRCVGNSYTWTAMASGEAADGTVFTEFIAGLNNAAFAGHTDWRLPHLKELQSIVDYSRLDPAIESVFDPSDSGNYWSVTTCTERRDRAWGIEFETGGTSRRTKILPFRARAVRVGKCPDLVF